MARNYAQEQRAQTPKRKANRASRNRARRKLGLKVGDPRQVHHKDGNPQNNSRKNLVAMSAKKNLSIQPKRK